MLRRITVTTWLVGILAARPTFGAVPRAEALERARVAAKSLQGIRVPRFPGPPSGRAYLLWTHGLGDWLRPTMDALRAATSWYLYALYEPEALVSYDGVPSQSLPTATQAKAIGAD